MKNVFLLILIVAVIFVSGCISQNNNQDNKTGLSPYENIIQNCYTKYQMIDKDTSPINYNNHYLNIFGISGWQTDGISNTRALHILLSSNGGFPNGFEPDLYVKSLKNTGSMLPTFGYESDLIVEKNPQNLKAGQIIIFNNPSSVEVAHRIVEMGRDEQGIFYQTKGDNNCIKDQFVVRTQDIVGRVIGTIY